MTTLLTPREVDRIFRYPRGRTLRLARAGKLPHIELPDGEIRFDPDAIERITAGRAADDTADAAAREQGVDRGT